MGLITILVGAGQAIGPLIGGAMNDAYSSLAPSYLFSGVVFVAAAGAALLLPRGSKSSRGPAVVLPELPKRRGVR